MVLLVTDGQSNVDSHLTEAKANALKTSGVEIYVVAVGSYIYGIDEIVKVASSIPQSIPPNPDPFLYRVKSLAGFWNIVKLIVKKVYPNKWHIVNYDPPC